MRLMFFWIVCILTALGSVIPRLFRPVVTEGQLEKQSYVVHLCESILRGDFSRGFPVRFFVELWHSGPIPWAEEFPLYHLLTAGAALFLGGNVVWAGRSISFLFGCLLLLGIHRLGRAVFSGDRKLAWIATTLMAAFPGFQIYSASVMPDLAMTAMIAFAFAFRIEGKPRQAYALLAVACLFKYFAVFALLALVAHDFFKAPSLRARLQVGVWGFLAALPISVFLVYFMAAGIPNPITEYRAGNGYGHLAGPFLLQIRFYSRALLWIFVKGPGLPGGLLFLGGLGGMLARFLCDFRRDRDQRQRTPKEFSLLAWFIACQALFALMFASSFFVHDYYALPFLIPAAIFGAWVFRWVEGSRIRAGLLIWLGAVLCVGVVQSMQSTMAQSNYARAAEGVRLALSDLPDRDLRAQVLYGSDFAVAPIPVLAGKSGWTFNIARIHELNSEHLQLLRDRLREPGLRALVLYAREGVSAKLFQDLQNLDSSWTQARVVSEKHFPAEGPRGSATVLKVLVR